MNWKLGLVWASQNKNGELLAQFKFQPSVYCLSGGLKISLEHNYLICKLFCYNDIIRAAPAKTGLSKNVGKAISYFCKLNLLKKTHNRR